VGDSGVGKSSCLFRYADEYYDEARTLSTIGIQRHQDHGREYHVCATGVDFRIVHRTVADRLIKVQIWDTAGQERFRTIAASYYRGADALVLVYDASSIDSLANLERVWLPEVERYKTERLLGSGNLMVLGNKLDAAVDLPPEQASKIQQAAQRFADTIGARHHECSAKSGDGVVEAFNVFIGSTARSKEFVNKPQHVKQSPERLCLDDAQFKSRGASPWWSSCFKGISNLFKTTTA